MDDFDWKTCRRAITGSMWHSRPGSFTPAARCTSKRIRPREIEIILTPADRSEAE